MTRAPRVPVLVCIGLWAAGAYALTPATIIDAQRVARPVVLHRLERDSVSYFDEQRVLRFDPLDTLWAIRFDARPDTVRGATVTVMAVDGQVFRGSGLTGGRDGQWLEVVGTQRGTVSLPLSRVVRVSLGGAGSVAEASTVDRLRLVNGDVLEGFVSALRDRTLELEVGGQWLSVGMDQVAELTLANAMEPPPTLPLLLLTDGSRWLARDLVIDERVARFTPGDGGTSASVELPLAELARVEFSRADQAMLVLAQQPWTVRAGGAFLGLPAAPRWDGEDLLIHPPVTLSMPFPPGGTHFSTVAHLAPPPGSDTDWASCDLLIRLDDEEVFRATLSAEHDQVPIELTLPEHLSAKALRLVIELREGRNSVLADGVRLVRPTLSTVVSPGR